MDTYYTYEILDVKNVLSMISDISVGFVLTACNVNLFLCYTKSSKHRNRPLKISQCNAIDSLKKKPETITHVKSCT